MREHNKHWLIFLADLDGFPLLCIFHACSSVFLSLHLSSYKWSILHFEKYTGFSQAQALEVFDMYESDFILSSHSYAHLSVKCWCLSCSLHVCLSVCLSLFVYCSGCPFYY